MELAELNDRGLVLVGCGRMGGALLKGWLCLLYTSPSPRD